LLIVTLTGCSSAGNSNCLVGSGETSKLVSVKGTFGTSQKVSFPTPLAPQSVERSTLKRGTGEALQVGQPYSGLLTLGDGETGETNAAGPVSLAVSPKQFPGLAKAMQCVTVGSRVAVTGTAGEVFGQQAQQLGLTSTQPVVTVIDVERALLPRANGTPRPGSPGFPTVVLAPNGQPGVTVPKAPAPKSAKVETLKQGSGPALKASDTAVVNYTAVQWEDNTVSKSSWDDGSPVGWALKAGTKDATVAPAGTMKALIGAKVGSQLVVMVPATKGASSLIYVIDVLGVA
jgi:peptidylprolyl isomerase